MYVYSQNQPGRRRCSIASDVKSDSPSLVLVGSVVVVVTFGHSQEILVHSGAKESWIGVPLHQGVDLKLGFVERVRGGLSHVVVYDFTHPRVEAHLYQDKTR